MKKRKDYYDDDNETAGEKHKGFCQEKWFFFTPWNIEEEIVAELVIMLYNIFANDNFNEI